MVAIQEEKIVRVIHRLEEEDTEDRRIRTEQGKDPNREPMLTLHPHSARLCHIMAQSICAKRLVEIGSSYGYSSVWLAHAARITGGQFTSLEVNPKLVEIAKGNVAEAGLTDNVTFIAGDARETMTSVEGSSRLRAARLLGSVVCRASRSYRIQVAPGRSASRGQRYSRKRRLGRVHSGIDGSSPDGNCQCSNRKRD